MFSEQVRDGSPLRCLQQGWRLLNLPGSLLIRCIIFNKPTVTRFLKEGEFSAGGPGRREVEMVSFRNILLVDKGHRVRGSYFQEMEDEFVSKLCAYKGNKSVCAHRCRGVIRREGCLKND